MKISGKQISKFIKDECHTNEAGQIIVNKTDVVIGLDFTNFEKVKESAFAEMKRVFPDMNL